MSQILEFGNDRILLIESNVRISEDMKKRLKIPFATLVYTDVELVGYTINQLIKELIDLGCVEFCCIGPYADSLHDLIDMLIEDLEAYHIVSTADLNPIEGIDYFINTAGRRLNCLLVIAPGDNSIISEIVDIIRRI
jgi:hypothetical protein